MMLEVHRGTASNAVRKIEKYNKELARKVYSKLEEKFH